MQGVSVPNVALRCVLRRRQGYNIEWRHEPKKSLKWGMVDAIDANCKRQRRTVPACNVVDADWMLVSLCIVLCTQHYTLSDG